MSDGRRPEIGRAANSGRPAWEPRPGAYLAALAGVLAAAALVAGTGSRAAVSAAAVLYVDANNPACSKSGPGSGSEAKPYCTISAAAAAAVAGQIVRVASGTYSETIKAPRSGTATAPITYEAAPGAVVTVRGTTYGFYLATLSYVTVDGFSVTQTPNDGIVVKSSSHITISNNHVSFAGKAVDGQTARGIRVENSTDSSIVGNTVDHNTTFGIYVLGGSTRNTISNNEIFANAQVFSRAASGIRLYGSPGNTVSSNVSYDNEDSGIEFVSSSTNNLAVNNLTYGNGDHGIDDLSSGGLRVIGNTVYDNVTAGINVEGG